MQITDFILLVEQEWRKARNVLSGTRINQINLSTQLWNELFSLTNGLCWTIGIGTRCTTYISIECHEDSNLKLDEIEFVYDSKTNDYQDFDFGNYRSIPFASAGIYISPAPVFGSAKLSGVTSNQTVSVQNVNAGVGPITITTPGNLHSMVYDDSHLNLHYWDTKGNTLKSTTHSCEWKRYNGFTQVYDYCTICDKKRELT